MSARIQPYFQRRVLLIALGFTPRLLTESLAALAMTSHVEMPTEIHVLTTEIGLAYVKTELQGKDNILAARALACIGDAYVGLEKYGDALNYFEKAAAQADNMFAASYLLKAGVVCEETGDNAKALSFYKQIKDKYPQSMEGYDIDKYISRIESQEAK